MELRKAPRVYADTRGMSRADWLRARRAGIGGSDAAGILGLSPYASPLSVWADKTCEDMPQDEKENEAIWLGNVLEDHVARRYAQDAGVHVVRCNMMLQHPEYPWMLANIDRRVVGRRVGIEIKTTSQNSRTDFAGGEINPWYYAQCMHYLAVTGWERWILVVLVIGKGMYTYEIEPNPEEIAALTDKERMFWEDYVVPRRMPPVDGSEASALALGLAYPQSNGETTALDCDDDIAAYLALDAQIREAKAAQEAARQRIEERMGAFEIGLTANYTVTWKNTKPRETLDSKRLRAEQPEIYRQYLKTDAPSRRFTVRQTKEV